MARFNWRELLADYLPIIEEKGYYNGIDLLEMERDLEGIEPDIYLATTNRGAGKTWFYLILLLCMFNQLGHKCALLYRKVKQIKDAYKKFQQVLEHYPELGTEIRAERRAEGTYYEMFLDDKSFGYVVQMKYADDLRDYGGDFRHVESLFLEEYQSENGEYLTDEFAKFQSLITTIARGGGSQSRPLKIFMSSNPVTIINPYYDQWDIGIRLKWNTKKLRGIGWVGDFELNESASNAIKENTTMRAFRHTEYSAYATEMKYLFDDTTMVLPPQARAKYMYTAIYKGKSYGVKYLRDYDCLYISKSIDPSHRQIIAITTDDMKEGAKLLKGQKWIMDTMKLYYYNGLIRYENLHCKSLMFHILGLDNKRKIA